MPPCATTSAGRAAPLPPSQRRAAIIEAVLPLLVECGVTATTRQLASAAGVSEGTLFNVFADKEALIGAAVDAATDPEPFERAVAAIDPAAPFDERLVAATRLIQRRIVDVWKLVSQLGTHAHHDHRRRPFPDSPALSGLFEPHADHLRRTPSDAAQLLRAMTLSMTHPLLTAAPSSAEEIVEMFLHGVATDGYDR